MSQFAKIKVDQGDVYRLRMMLAGIKNGYPKAMSRAINAGLATARVESRREVQKEVTASTKYVNRAFAENKATYSRLTGSLVVSGKPIPLIAYDTRQTGKGVTVRVNVSGERSLLPHAVSGKVKNVSKAAETSEHKGVFLRKYSGPRKPFWKKIKYGALPKEFRLPIEQKFGPSIPAIFERGPILEYIKKLAAIRASDEFARQVELLLK